MRKIKEVLRLKFSVGLGLRAIARSCSIGLGTVPLRYLSRRRTLARLSHRILEALAVGCLARQWLDFLCLHSAVRATNSIQFDDHRRLELEARQISHFSLVDLVDVLDPPPATRTSPYPVAPLAAHPQLQCLGSLVDLVTIDPVARPAQDLGEVVVGRQTLKSTESNIIHNCSAVWVSTDSCSEPTKLTGIEPVARLPITTDPTVSI